MPPLTQDPRPRFPLAPTFRRWVRLSGPGGRTVRAHRRRCGRRPGPAVARSGGWRWVATPVPGRVASGPDRRTPRLGSARDCPDLSARRRDRAASRRGGRPRRRRRSGGPLAPLGRALSGGWLLLARGAGGAARAVGRQAATARLDPAHRRDGLGLAVVAVAVVTGVALWSSGGGPVGRVVHDLLRGGVGTARRRPAGAAPGRRPAPAAPAAQARGARPGRHRLGRARARRSPACSTSATAGPPTGPAGTAPAGCSAPGSAGPLQRGVGTALAVLLLVLVLFFGLLVVTKTPVNRIPHRIREARDRLLRRPPAAAEPDGPDGPDERGRAADRGADRAAGPAAPPVPPPAGLAGRPGPVRRGCGRVGRRAAGPAGRAGARRRHAAAGPPSRSRRRSPARSSSPVRRDRLHAAAVHPARRRHPAEGQDQGQRRGDRRAAAACSTVRCGRRGHRLHPRPDRHPLRGGARARRQGRADHPAVPQHRVRGEVAPTCGSSARSRASARSASRSPTPTGRTSASATCCARGAATRDHHPMVVGARQGHRGRLRRGQPGQDAAHPHRRRDRRGQVVAASTRCSCRSWPGPPRTRCGCC